MEKALDVLKKLCLVVTYNPCLVVTYNQYLKPKIEKVISELEEAIAEIEAMKPKTCEKCKHYEEKQCTNENSIAFGGINAVYKDDFCNDFEPKEQL